MRSLILLAAQAVSIFASPSAPPDGALIVGAGGQYKTIQSAVNAAGAGKTIYINAGTYNEQVTIEGAGKKGIILMGATDDAAGYKGNKVTMKQDRAQDRPKGLSNDQTGTLRVKSDGVKVYNLNLENTRGKGSQALALSAYGSQLGFYGCQFKGFQDTVMPNDGSQVFAKSLIIGATDFIFGQKAKAWFENVDIQVVSGANGWITANGRDSSSNPSYYVFNNCDIGGSASKASYYLGRPWRAYSRVVFQNTKMSAVVHPDGWSIWNKGDEKTSNVEWGEYNNSGPGSQGSRKFGKKLSAAVPITTILGSNYQSWVDMKYTS